MNKAKIFFPNLDALRFFAFAFVFLQHAFGNLFIGLNSLPVFLKQLLEFVFINGETGVSVFFVLSGFLITYLILSEINLRGNLNLKNFYIRRGLRIWPLYYLVVVFAFEIYPFFKSLMGIQSELCSRSVFFYLFLANFEVIQVSLLCAGNDALIENITWSVAIEEQFYLIWPVLFWLVPKRFFSLIFYLVILASIIFRFFNQENNAVLYFHTLSVCGDLAMGGLGAYYAINNRRFLLFFQQLNPKIVALIYLLGFTHCIFADLLEITVFKRIIDAAFFMVIILDQNFNRLNPFKFSKLQAISGLGKYTYGYYLLHPIAILAVSNIYRLQAIPRTSIFHTVSDGLTALVLTFIMGYVSYNYFEIYFVKLKSRFAYITKG